MSRRYWSADIHANHANICIYTKRPWIRPDDLNDKGRWVSQEAAVACAKRMNRGIIQEFNMRIKPEDRVTHVGDFATHGKVLGIEGTRESYRDFLSQLNGTWTLMEGNHDRQGKVKTTCVWMVSPIGLYTAFVSHWPTTNPHIPPALRAYAKEHCEFAICGHVHDKWNIMYDDGFLNINVGVDVRKYRPMSDDEVIGVYERSRKEVGRDSSGSAAGTAGIQ